MKVGIVCKPLDRPFSGSGSHLKGLISAFESCACDVEITLLSYSKLEFGFSKCFKNIVLSGNYIYDTFLINKCGFDIVHFNPLTIFSPIFVKASRVTTIHGASGVTLKRESGIVRFLHDKYLRRILAKRMDHVFTVSEVSRDWLQHHYKLRTDFITVVYNGVSDQIRALFDGGQNRTCFKDRDIILHVSNYSERKNPSMVLKVFHEASILDKNIDFVIAGKGWDNDVISAYLVRHGLVDRVSVLGFVSDSDLANLYSRAKVYFSPSLYEGFGMPNIEAMYCGTPVVISRAFAAGSIAGRAAHVSDDHDDFEFFTEAILKLSKDEGYWRMYSELSILQSGRYTWRSSASKTLKVYRAIEGRKL